MVSIIFTIIGAIGLVLISIGVLVKKKDRKIRDIVYIFGGASLLVYSVALRNFIFIILQLVFIVVSIYDLIKLNKKKR